MNWYTLRVISGKEKKIKENLLFELNFQDLSVEIGDILVPSENIVEMKEGKKKIKNNKNHKQTKIKLVQPQKVLETRESTHPGAES